MKKYLDFKIHNIKNIKSLNFDIPLEKGLYGITGTNGCGKSTIMLALSQLVRKTSLKKLSKLDYNKDSYVKFFFDGKEDFYYYDNDYSKWQVKGHPPVLHFDGFYEGSIFYGTRFTDSAKAETIMEDIKNSKDIFDADSFIIEKLGEIMHDDKTRYMNLKKLRNMTIAKKYGFDRMPYFLETENGLISQLAMSSGECMVITMLHFVFQIVVRENYNKKNEKIIFLIDEVELALHPSAIDRLIKFINGLVAKSELVCIFSSHSAEVIRKLNPKNIYQLENRDGIVYVINPCYPSYAIRDLYTQDGFDFLLLVEDELARKVVNEILMKNGLFKSKLIHVLPCGDWFNNLRLHDDILRNNVLGVGKQVISILDGDVIEKVNNVKNYNNLKKMFLPIKSIEKYLYEKLINNIDYEFMKFFGDKYFRTRSLKDIVSDYRTNFNVDKDSNGKKLYDVLTSNMFKTGMDEEQFLNHFCRDLMQQVDTEHFEKSLTSLLT